MKPLQRTALVAAVSLAFALPAAAQVSPPMKSSDEWAWRATLYGWLPNVKSTAHFPVDGGNSINVDTDPGSYLRNLEFVFMGTLEARKGPWSFVGDAIYLSFGKADSRLTQISGPGGIVLPLPTATNVDVDLKGFTGTLEAGYALIQQPTANLDLVAGARYLTLKTTLTWTFTGAPPNFPPGGSRERRADFWDGVVGVRGKSALDDAWFLSYYADVGAGSSQRTWQAFGGVGYRFKWGDALIGYRYLAYNFKSDAPVSDLAFGGPLVGVAFNF
jgi:hypothetical protein